MDFTFGIITINANINLMILSIEKLKIPNYEIIIVCNKNNCTEYENISENIIIIPFDESIKPNWITRKKNIICQKARYENIVLLHDYIELCEDWYIGFLKFGNDFDICVSKILNKNGLRFRDYIIFPTDNGFNNRTLLPYNYPSSIKLSKILYISGAYYIIKKHIALQYPLDERLVWAKGEDLYLCKQLVNNNIIMKCNQYSTVIFLKQKDSCSWEQLLTNDDIIKFENLSNDEIEIINQTQYNELKQYGDWI